MKVAIYLADGVEQIILTPERPMERVMLDRLFEAPRNIRHIRGDFEMTGDGYARKAGTNNSLIFVVEPTPSEVVTLPPLGPYTRPE